MAHCLSARADRPRNVQDARKARRQDALQRLSRVNVDLPCGARPFYADPPTADRRAGAKGSLSPIRARAFAAGNAGQRTSLPPEHGDRRQQAGTFSGKDPFLRRYAGVLGDPVDRQWSYLSCLAGQGTWSDSGAEATIGDVDSMTLSALSRARMAGVSYDDDAIAFGCNPQTMRQHYIALDETEISDRVMDKIRGGNGDGGNGQSSKGNNGRAAEANQPTTPLGLEKTSLSPASWLNIVRPMTQPCDCPIVRDDPHSPPKIRIKIEGELREIGFWRRRNP